MKNQVFIKNRPATFEYAIEDRLTVGMILAGSEIKSIRESKVSFNDSYCLIHKGELYVKSLYIGQYTHAGYAGHEPVHDRKLLLTKKELHKWGNKVKEKGFSIIPLHIFINEKGLAKMEIGLGKGKKLHDKRESIKARDMDKEIKRHLK
jgi:SsrA-binding protein